MRRRSSIPSASIMSSSTGWPWSRPESTLAPDPAAPSGKGDVRPRIGITSWHYRDDEERWEAVLDSYTRAVLEAGGLPVILPIVLAEPALSPEPSRRIEACAEPRRSGPALVEEYLETIDGLILTGGADIHPSFYGQILLERCGEIDEERDRFEVELIRAARGFDLPFLGICRGLQVLNVALGGSLYPDLSYLPLTHPS